MLILLPPSEGKTAPRRGLPLDLAGLSSPALTPAREQLLAELTTLSRERPDDAAAALGLGPTQRDLLDANASLAAAPTARADRVYAGVLYDALAPTTLTAAGKRRAGRRLAITSALFGLLRPADRIPGYRLSGGTVLPGTGPVAAHWRRHLGAAVEDAMGDGLLVDLRSSAYTAFWRPAPARAARTATVRVLHEQDGRRSVVSHFNKATKGRLVRALLEAGADPRTPRALADAWRDLGWTVEAEPERTGTRLDVVVSQV